MLLESKRLAIRRLIKGAAALALFAIYGELVSARFSVLAYNLASDACGQTLYPDNSALVMSIAPVAIAAPVLAYLARPWPLVRLAIVVPGLAALAAFMFAARVSDVIKWSCDIGGGAIFDYASGLLGVVLLVWMGIVGLADFWRKASLASVSAGATENGAKQEILRPLESPNYRGD
jgi:hypothetical protein